MDPKDTAARIIESVKSMQERKGPMYERYLANMKRFIDGELERLENERREEQTQRAGGQDEEATRRGKEGSPTP